MKKLLGVIFASILHIQFILHVHAFACRRELPRIIDKGTHNCVQFVPRDLSETNDENQSTPERKRPANTGFSYRNTGAWVKDSPECGGKRQSPVNLNSDKLIDLEVPSSLKWTGYSNQPQNLTIVDNGHTVELSGTWDEKLVPFVSGGPLTSEYLFAQLHFHWGPKNSAGSEHTIDDKHFPMEMHIVHYKRDYKTFQEALKHDDGLAVAAYFYEIDDSSKSGINILQDGLKKIRNKPRVRTPVKPFPLSSLQVEFSKDYATYSGSLTTPPCREIVTWILSYSPLMTSHKVLESFRKISRKWPDKKNYRTLQPVNNRCLYYVDH